MAENLPRLVNQKRAYHWIDGFQQPHAVRVWSNGAETSVQGVHCLLHYGFGLHGDELYVCSDVQPVLVQSQVEKMNYRIVHQVMVSFRGFSHALRANRRSAGVFLGNPWSAMPLKV